MPHRRAGFVRVATGDVRSDETVRLVPQRMVRMQWLGGGDVQPCGGEVSGSWGLFRRRDRRHAGNRRRGGGGTLRLNRLNQGSAGFLLIADGHSREKRGRC